MELTSEGLKWLANYKVLSIDLYNRFLEFEAREEWFDTVSLQEFYELMVWIESLSFIDWDFEYCRSNIPKTYSYSSIYRVHEFRFSGSFSIFSEPAKRTVGVLENYLEEILGESLYTTTSEKLLKTIITTVEKDLNQYDTATKIT